MQNIVQRTAGIPEGPRIPLAAGLQEFEPGSHRVVCCPLATFKVPKGVVVVDSLPKNPSGKLLKRELRRRLEGRYAG